MLLPFGDLHRWIPTASGHGARWYPVATIIITWIQKPTQEGCYELSLGQEEICTEFC